MNSMSEPIRQTEDGAARAPTPGVRGPIMLGVEGGRLTPGDRTRLGDARVGGVILFRRNIEDAVQTYKLVKELRATVPTPMFHCIDLEGGTVDRLRDMIAPAPSAEKVFATGRKSIYREHGRLLGEECSALGFNTDFAPVSDLGFEIGRASCRERV